MRRAAAVSQALATAGVSNASRFVAECLAAAQEWLLSPESPTPEQFLVWTPADFVDFAQTHLNTGTAHA